MTILPFLFALLVQAPAAPASTAAALPAGLTLAVRLDTVIDHKQSKVDDPIVATLTKDAKLNGKVILPKKTAIHGKLRFLDKKKDQAVLGIEFTEAESDGVRYRVVARLEEFVSELSSRKELPSVTRAAATSDANGGGDAMVINTGASVQILPNNTPGVGTFVVYNGKFTLRNLQMVWKTLAAAAP